MADPATYRPASGSIPESPGVYRFRDEHGRVIYVGKAKSLRQRLNSYFADFSALHPRTQTMVRTAAKVDWTVVATEVEALQLEYSWIKEFDPRFNVRYRDDKSYPYLAVTLNEEFPRVMVMRGAKRKGVRYFGPYSHAWAIRETVDQLLRVFPVRTCSAGVFKRQHQLDRPCLLGYIGKCSAPCVGRVTPDEHRLLAEDFCDFMAGHTTRFIKRLERDMREAAASQEYERAARLRDDVRALERALEKQAVVLPDRTDCDMIAFAEDELEAAVQVFYVRGGRIRGQRGWVVDKVEDVTTADLVEHFLIQIYSESESVPREVFVPAVPPEEEAMTELLSEQRGGPVRLRVPQRGDKKSLLETVARNAHEALKQHKTRRASDLTTRSRALQEIQDALELDDAPLRIECYDVSNLQGTNVVASMVVFEDGLARKSEYRRFTIKAVEGQDDVRSIHEVITRRFKRYLAESEKMGELDHLGDPDEEGAHQPIDPETGRPRKFAYPPNLVVVDGGPPQVAAAQRALDELGVDDIAVCGIAKRLEEIWLPGEGDPVILPRNSEGMFLVQRVRDEAHRFAITFHRQRRSKSMTVSELDNVPGLGPARRAALLKHFGSLKRLKDATPEQVAEVPGIGLRSAEGIVAALHGTSGHGTSGHGTSGHGASGHGAAVPRGGGGTDGAGTNGAATGGNDGEHTGRGS
ncbi:excinuclease ABC subunit UvrC [Actinomadura sp. KC06]|uniref:excinuclease ABC subunit UvrC n=1 Tax=Actinomadura sp. KC06 TaxID=2530369 RepID=UPI00104E40FE|nr:excinuclease ABC subunit UvrC [Actinomadura sp. KC06]TDD40460.1 excinuclease ABC subunit UvrC [Actinomadura sp. KC06]